MRKELSILQIFILIVGTIAISYAIGSSVEVVGASGKGENQEPVNDDEKPANDLSFLAEMGWVSKKGLSVLANPSKAGAAAAEGFPSIGGSSPELVDFGLGDGPMSGLNKPTTLKEILNTRILGKATINNILTNAAYAAGVYLGVKVFLPLIPGIDENAVNAAAAAASAGTFVGTTAHSIGLKAGLLGSTGLGIAVGIGIFVATYKRTQEKRIEFMCEVWDAPLGGDNCELCNEGILPCSEYQCKALGQSCELINQGTGEELCVWQNRNDAEPPAIQPWDDALKTNNYSYSPDNTISPPNRGVYIKYNRGCIPAFTPFTFGITLDDEPAKCKVDTVQKQTFDDMPYYFGGSSTAKYNHTMSLNFPGPDALEAENITLQNDGEYTLYTKCQDANGNFNTADFVFKYCIDSGPDTTAPVIVATSLKNATKIPVAYNQSNFDIELYTNEPADCRWTHDADADFSNMENDMDCPGSVLKMNAQMLYTCSATLSGIEDKKDNKFYFRCKDKPNAPEEKRFANAQGYLITLVGTQPIVITDYSPADETIKGSGDSVRVTLEAETAAGYDKGISTCYYSSSCFNKDASTSDYADIIGEDPFDSNSHTEDIFVSPGNYDCSIKCLDEGGNTDSVVFSYTVETDEAAPVVVRAYHSGTNLRIRTDEKAGCVYSNTDCTYTFENGEPLTTVNELDHTTNWNSEKTYYIKCQDEFTNEPYPNECSIILRPSENY